MQPIDPPEPMPPSPCSLAPVPNLAAIAVRGADAAAFLGAQLSQRPPQPGDRRAPLTAWHDPKGRVQALFRVLARNDGSFTLLTDASVAEAVVAGLGRFVLRARVELGVIAAHDAAAAVIGDATDWLRRQQIDVGDDAGAFAERDGSIWLRVGPTLLYVTGPALAAAVSAGELPNLPPEDAELAAIRLGLPTVSAALRGLFLPQMLNLDRLGGIAFDKGCYPGQEIIARTQNLGSVKRRLLRLESAIRGTAPPAGAALADENGRMAGIVVRAAAGPDAVELLAVVDLAAQHGMLHTLAEGTAPLELFPAPAPG
jgi:folate-binding protein YgfZ